MGRDPRAHAPLYSVHACACASHIVDGQYRYRPTGVVGDCYMTKLWCVDLILAGVMAVLSTSLPHRRLHYMRCMRHALVGASAFVCVCVCGYRGVIYNAIDR